MGQLGKHALGSMLALQPLMNAWHRVSAPEAMASIRFGGFLVENDVVKPLCLPCARDVGLLHRDQGATPRLTDL